jgi:hypothetical protein
VAVFAGHRPVGARLLFPAPHRFPLPGGLVALGYEGEVVYPLQVEGAATIRPPLRAVVDYVACAVECIPFRDELELAAGAPEGGEDALLAAWQTRLPKPAGAAGVRTKLDYRRGTDPALLLALDGAALAGAAPELFLEPTTSVTFGEPRLRTGATRASFEVPLHAEVEGQLPRSLRVAWTVTGLHGSGEGLAVEGVATAAASTTATAVPPPPPGTKRAKALALLGLLVLLVALGLWLAPTILATAAQQEVGGAPSLRAERMRLFGFLVAAGLVGVAYRLALVLPTARLAGVEVSWLLVALGVRSASARAGLARVAWLLVAAAAAGFGLWLA